jgi:hypothetical protein
LNPLRWFRRTTTEPRADLPPPSPPSSAVTPAGLFDTDGLARDGALAQLRQAPPPTTLADLSTNDPRSTGVVYKQVSGRGVRLNHGSVVEGSVDFGGLQPNYVVDLKHPRLQQLLAAARALDRPGATLEEKVNGVVALVQKTLTEGAYDAPAYLKLLAEHRSQRVNITLGDYLVSGAGVCRENALLTHLALLEAGLESEYLYCRAGQGGRVEDHAVALVVAPDGRKVVVDSYNRNFHGFALDDLLRPGGSQSTDRRLAGGRAPSLFGCTLSVADHPVYWIPVRALRAPLPVMPPIDELRDFRVVRPAR